MSKLVLPYMIAQGSGSIVNFASVHALASRPALLSWRGRVHVARARAGMRSAWRSCEYGYAWYDRSEFWISFWSNRQRKNAKNCCGTRRDEFRSSGSLPLKTSGRLFVFWQASKPASLQGQPYRWTEVRWRPCSGKISSKCSV